MIFVVYLLALIHCLLAFVSFLSFVPITIKKEDKAYNDEFIKVFPFLSKFSWIFLVVPIIYFLLYFAFCNNDSILEDIGNITPLIYILCFSAVIMLVPFILTIKKYKAHKSDTNFKLGFAAYLYIYSVSVLCGITIVHCANYALDSSTGEENIVNITFMEDYTTGGTSEKARHKQKSTTDTHYTTGTKYHYKFTFSPEVKGKSSLEVTKDVYEEAKIGDKLKLYVKNGFFGLPFISSNRIVIKQNTEKK